MSSRTYQTKTHRIDRGCQLPSPLSPFSIRLSPSLNQEVPDLTFAKFLLLEDPDETKDTPDRYTLLAFELMKLAQRCSVSVSTCHTSFRR